MLSFVRRNCDVILFHTCDEFIFCFEDIIRFSIDIYWQRDVFFSQKIRRYRSDSFIFATYADSFILLSEIHSYVGKTDSRAWFLQYNFEDVKVFI